MILPSKHLPQNRALLTVGAMILNLLSQPTTVSALWEDIARRRQRQLEVSPIRYDAFVLSLDLLFLMGAIDLHDGLLRRISK